MKNRWSGMTSITLNAGKCQNSYVTAILENNTCKSFDKSTPKTLLIFQISVHFLLILVHVTEYWYLS